MANRYSSIVVKIGSNLLTRDDGMLNVARMAHFVDQIAALQKKGVRVILVSSGAVAAGRAEVEPQKKHDTVSRRQLWSAVGQVKLINRYADLFREHGLTCAQVLTTKENFSDRQHYLNMRNCINTLLESSVIPIINENDAISVTELMFTDNDELSGLIASMMDVEALFLLTNVDGVFRGNPGEPGSELIRHIAVGETVSEELISAQKSNFGRGGMLTKSSIASKLAGQGVAVHIANGIHLNILTNLMEPEADLPHTWFEPEKRKSNTVKKWLAHSDDFARGEVFVNDGARDALLSERATSLLTIGITGVQGQFKTGDIVRVKDVSGKLLGLGKAGFSSKIVEREMGSKYEKPFIHYDYLYLG
jgi:glutamate 5-kinase